MRNLRVDTIVSATLGLALIVAGMPGSAEAGVCSTVGKANGCVNGKDVKDNRLQAADLKDEPGADFASGDQSAQLGSAAVIVRSVIITAPSPGRVIVNASGSFLYQSGAPDIAHCSITTGVALDATHLIAAGESNQGADSMLNVPFGATRGFDVAAGSTAFNLVCAEISGNVFLQDTSLTAIFVPTAY